MDQLQEIIIRHEGLKLKPYKDTTGHLTIGVGRNLDDRGISREEALLLLKNDLRQCVYELDKYDWYHKLNAVRQEVLIELLFNIGLPKLLDFKKMINALTAGDYETAAKELLGSVWANQVGPTRSKNMSTRLLAGKYL